MMVTGAFSFFLFFFQKVLDKVKNMIYNDYNIKRNLSEKVT